MCRACVYACRVPECAFDESNETLHFEVASLLQRELPHACHVFVRKQVTSSSATGKREVKGQITRGCIPLNESTRFMFAMSISGTYYTQNVRKV